MGKTENKTGANPGNAAGDTPPAAQGKTPGADQAGAKAPDAAKPPVATTGTGADNTAGLQSGKNQTPEAGTAEALHALFMQLSTEEAEKAKALISQRDTQAPPAFDAASMPNVNQFLETHAGIPDEHKAAFENSLRSYVAALDASKKKADPTMLGPVDEAAHQANLKRYGKNYVTAQKGKMRTIFSAEVWKNLSEGKDGRRDGWAQVVATPPEVTNLKKAK